MSVESLLPAALRSEIYEIARPTLPQLVILPSIFLDFIWLGFVGENQYVLIYVYIAIHAMIVPLVDKVWVAPDSHGTAELVASKSDKVNHFPSQHDPRTPSLGHISKVTANLSFSIPAYAGQWLQRPDRLRGGVRLNQMVSIP